MTTPWQAFPAVAILAGLVGLLMLAPASLAAETCPATLHPPPLSFETCKTVGGGTIASGNRTVSYGPVDTGITCNSGASAFDIFDQGAYNQNAVRWYNESGNLTRRRINDDYTFGQWSNPEVGTTVSYTQHDTEIDDLSVPGDLNSSITAFTGENVFRTGTGAPVLVGNGRQVSNIDSSVLYSSAGRNDFIAAFFQGDPAAFDPVCAALSGP